MENFDVLSRWTVWANGRLLEAVGRLAAADYYKVRASAFGSIHFTLNHLLATDRIWIGRLSGRPHGVTALDEVLYGDFETLLTARTAEDARLIEVVEGLQARRVPGEILDFASMDGTPRRMPVDLVLSQLFLHHAHHRGQVHVMLSQTNVAPPALDLTYFPGATA